MHIDIQPDNHPAFNFYLDRASWQGEKSVEKTQVYSSPISELLKGLKHLLGKIQKI